MTDEIVKIQSKQTLGRVRGLLSKNSVENSDRVNGKREQFLALIKSKYGYTNEKAVDELERLLRQFYKMNKSLGIHHARPNFNNPAVE